MNEQADEPGIVLTEEQKRRRRARSIAIALSLGALVLLFYVVTLVKWARRAEPAAVKHAMTAPTHPTASARRRDLLVAGALRRVRRR